MKLFETAATPSSRRVSIFLKFLNTDVERIQLDLKGGDNLVADFQSRNPSGTVPMLELDDGTCISESVAVCRYLDSVVDNKHDLFGKGAVEQAQVEMWHRVVELQGLMMAFQGFRNISGFYADRENCVAAWGEEAKQRAVSFVDKLEKRLSQYSYVVGDRLTIVDITAFLFVNVMKMAFKVEFDAQYPAIVAWHAKLSAMPEFQ
ncbi:glutathione S-transferase family protein [Vibrio gallicus]|uniref:glutathione S-transferase family protein n=1 Tax=Vibrio gallicus TaxID=190897 RepID=UPI0021C2BB20|nr:glutathione S-transferase [Vibrio gallicus]